MKNFRKVLNSLAFNRWALLGALTLTVSVQAAETAPAVTTPLKAGQTILPLTLTDQNDKSFTLNGKVKLLVFAQSMESSRIVSETFQATNQAKLEEHGIVYLADISRMPGLIAKMVALPKMRKYPYSVYLDREGQDSKTMPLRDKDVTVLGSSSKRGA
jgi:hypothetical protein